jgi:hypothetical protein
MLLNECTIPILRLNQNNAAPGYHPNLSNSPLLLTSLFLLPPGSALVQSTMSPASTPNMLILLIALTNATSHTPLLNEKELKGTVVRGCCAMFLSAGSVKGARPSRVSEKYLLSQMPTVESMAVPAREGSTTCSLAVVCAPISAARSMGEKPLEPGVSC